MDRFDSMCLLVRVVERQNFSAPRVRVFIDWLVQVVAPRL